MDDEIKMNRWKEIAVDAEIRMRWVAQIDAFTEPTKLDQAILFTLYENKNPSNGTKEWTIKDLERRLDKNFNELYESLYNHLKPKGLLIIERKKGEGNKKFISLTTIGEKFVYSTIERSKEYCEKTIKDYTETTTKKEKINML